MTFVAMFAGRGLVSLFQSLSMVNRLMASVLLAAVPVEIASAQSSTPPTASPSAPPSQSGQAAPAAANDGWPDLSNFLDKKLGFLPIATIITEPAVGVGVAGGLAFINGQLSSRPDITYVGGMGTENGTKGAFVGDMRQWFDGRLETRLAVFAASVNLDFYGVGQDPALADAPLRYGLEPTGGVVEGRYRVAGPVWVGLGYSYMQAVVAFDAPAGTPGLPDFRHESAIGSLGPSLTLDTRDNLFTPTRGTYVEGSMGIFRKSLGADDDYERVQVTAIQYIPLPGKVFAGTRIQATTSSDDTPFYLRPFVLQRGVQAMRYLGERMAQIEGEVRWQFWNRFSVLGFGGTGTAWSDLPRVTPKTTVSAAGGGIRYELARKYGIHVGVDAAWGPDGSTVYLQWGSAWLRP